MSDYPLLIAMRTNQHSTNGSTCSFCVEDEVTGACALTLGSSDASLCSILTPFIPPKHSTIKGCVTDAVSMSCVSTTVAISLPSPSKYCEVLQFCSNTNQSKHNDTASSIRKAIWCIRTKNTMQDSYSTCPTVGSFDELVELMQIVHEIDSSNG